MAYSEKSAEKMVQGAYNAPYPFPYEEVDGDLIRQMGVLKRDTIRVMKELRRVERERRRMKEALGDLCWEFLTDLWKDSGRRDGWEK